MIHHISKLKKNNYMVISINTEKAFDKIQPPFLIKTISKLVIEENFLNFIKSIYKKPTVSIILNGEKLEVFPLTLGTRQGCSLSPLLFNIIQEVLANAVRKRNKRYTNCEGRSKTIFLCK